jgi:hypothetical protein
MCTIRQQYPEPQEVEIWEAASAKVIEETSKPCPAYKSRIYRNGGCGHMVCKFVLIVMLCQCAV